MSIAYIILLVIGVIALVFFGRNVMLGRKSQNWPNAPGTILQTGMETYQSTDEDGSTSTTYDATIMYSYEVGDQSYQGNRRTFTNVRTGSRRRVEQILARYPQGGAVSVYYDPANPAESVLETGVNTFAYVVLVIAGILVLAGIAGLLGLFG
jgi:hypothetical protein